MRQIYSSGYNGERIDLGEILSIGMTEQHYENREDQLMTVVKVPVLFRGNVDKVLVTMGQFPFNSGEGHATSRHYKDFVDQWEKFKGGVE